MTDKQNNIRLCEKGHEYSKTSDCPTCPFCEQERKPTQGLLALLSAPARRALESKGIKTIEELSLYSEKEILTLHGMGKASLPILRKALEENNLCFK